MKEHITEEKAIELLKKHIPDEKVFKTIFDHVKAVQKVAVEFAEKIPQADVEFVKTAALLHDIGRAQYPPGSKNKIRHGIMGAEILRKEGLPEHADVAERHIGAGISKEDIEEQSLDLPIKDYIPMTVEEKIITDADNLIFYTTRKTIDDVYDRFKKEVNIKLAEKAKALHNEVKEMMQEDGDD